MYGPRNLKVASVSFAFGLALTGCGNKKSSSTDTSNNNSGGGVTSGGSGSGSGSGTSSSPVPQVGAISLQTLGTGTTAPTSLMLAANADGCNNDNLGVMGLALGGACHTAPLAQNILGLDPIKNDFNGDGKIDCADFTAAKLAGKDPGLMLNLICQPVILNNNNITSLAFQGSGNSIGVGFAPWTGDTNNAVGSWSAGNAASYPADIRIWTGTTSITNLNGLAAIALTNNSNGTIQMPDLSGGTTSPIPLALTFKTQTSTTNCATAVNDANCHWQDIQISRGEVDTNGGGPNAAHLKIWADDKKAPTVIAIEGSYYFSAGSASHWGAGQTACPFTALSSTRTIYFQVVQKGGQVWGMFDFRDANGALLTCPITGAGDPFAMMAANTGICQNVGTTPNPQWVPCTAVSAATFPGIWKGETAFTSAKGLTIPLTLFKGAPTAAGICLTPGGCRAFQASDIK